MKNEFNIFMNLLQYLMKALYVKINNKYFLNKLVE